MLQDVQLELTNEDAMEAQAGGVTNTMALLTSFLTTGLMLEDRQ